ncbi:zinc finger protein 600-like isoform X2 [Pararge aegeria]|uniref:zinc finger protein 600-like isoform X2 n=1 Tax=Pararge aegeria TaxID=116150 RepID=UPI0019D1D873|nr:zinc finger protein 600-like isoform X2 [Pararge aegeria]
MSEIFNLSTLCRCCHTDGSFRSLDLLYSFKGKTEVYADMLNKTFGLMLSHPSIEASHSICEVCIEKLRNALQFKKQVEQCEMMFEDYCKNELALKTEIKIEKQETDVNENSYDQDCKELVPHIDDEDNTVKLLKTEDQKKKCQETLTSHIPMTKSRNSIKKQELNTLNADIHQKQRLEKQKSHVAKTKIQSKSKLAKSGLGRYTQITHTQRKQYKCPIKKISEIFDEEQIFKSHILMHKRFVCNICGNRFKCINTLITHRINHASKKVFTCDMCNKDFLYKSTLIKHIALHLGNKKKLICDICGKSFNDRTNLNIHIRNVHEKLRLFKCDQCPKVYASNKTLRVHLRVHSGERPYKCKFCDKALICSNTLRWHTENHHPTALSLDKDKQSLKPSHYKCKVCDKIIYSRGGFAAHTRAHKGNNPYKCHLCEKDFTCKYGQRRHIESHRSDNTVPCKICHKIFSGKITLDRHVKIIHDPNRQQCTQKFKCHMCKRSVKDLERHLKGHTKSHLCSYCPKAYADGKGLNMHIKESHMGISHDCDLCEKKYIKLRSLKKHKSKIHNIQFKVEEKDDGMIKEEK